MKKLIMLIGLSGSGKSTFAEEHSDAFILSSDVIRRQLFGDARIQSKSHLVFEEIVKRAINIFNSNSDCVVIIDACNLRALQRKGLLDCIKAKCEIDICHAYVMRVPLWECLKNNLHRKAIVPDSTIMNMRNSFQFPVEGEGFDFIHNWGGLDEIDRFTENNFCESMHRYPQENPHHDYDLLTHCEKVAEYVKEKAPDDEILYQAALLHDIGKLLTKGKKSEGHYNYLGHHSAGAYWLFSEGCFIDLEVIVLIQYHMLVRFELGNAKPQTIQRWKDLLGEQRWKRIELLNEADAMCHKEIL